MKKRLLKIATLILVVVMLASILVPIASARWVREGDGWGEWRYRTGATTYAEGWRQIDGTWYFFYPHGWDWSGWMDVTNLPTPAAGFMARNTFVYHGGSWYWLDASGAMATGWARPGGGSQNWYYFNPDGTMRTGWLYWNGSWYWLHTAATAEASDRVFNWSLVVDGVWWSELPRVQTAGTDWPTSEWALGVGAMAQNESVVVGGLTYHFNAAGVMAAAPAPWRHIGDYWFFYNEHGARVTGWQQWNGQWYWLHTQASIDALAARGEADMLTGELPPLGAMARGIVNTTGLEWHAFHAVNGAWLNLIVTGPVPPGDPWR